MAMAKDETSMTKPTQPALTAALDACRRNGDRLLDDGYQVEFQKPPATKLMLAMIAQEEFAKAFLLFLVRENIVPWTPELLRAMNDHACKQLVAVIIDYADPQWVELDEIKKLISDEYDRDGKLPFNVSTAINILRHEKIGRWESNRWVWVEEPTYDKAVLGIASGKRDKIKQDALYVRLGRTASVVSTPESVTSESADREFEKAKQYSWFIRSIIERGWNDSVFHNKVRDAFAAVFAPPAKDQSG